MRRNWLFLALLLSVGVNCGLLGMGIMRHRMLSVPSGMPSGGAPGDHRAPGDPGERPPGRQGARLADRLGLLGEERERFLGLQRQLAERVHAGRRRIDDGRRELRRELTSTDLDRGRVEELLAGIGSEQNALDRALVENVLAARELLDGDAEREYLHFVERFGGAFAGGRPPGPPGFEAPAGGPRPRFGDRRMRRQGGPPGQENSDDGDRRGAPDGPP
ncbi:MAG: periplasmic heavy metal sensor [Thermoanaerobaculia bacterium]|nr:periplasmic heavy metal sensor [Thermoanaerobaculia bacterium]MBP9824299.1 periplasmic heavy metal sensor [Thermoanaerobaculia bacterium]